MAKNKLFKDLEVSNKPNRTGFDLSHSVKFTAKCGELLPIMHRTMMPGDNFKINLSNFTRTDPVNTAAHTKIREYFDVFFVPYRLIGKQIPHVLAQDKDNPVIANSSVSNRSLGKELPNILFEKLYRYTDSPTLNESGYVQALMQYKNSFGFNRGVLATKLLNHLGYCNYSFKDLRTLWKHSAPSADTADVEITGVVNVNPFGSYPNVTILPLACYQKIYYDFFRNTQWEDNQPYNYNMDYLGADAVFYVDTRPAFTGTSNYWRNPTIFDLRYSNYPKDLFFGLMPDSQYGDESVVEIESNDTNVDTNFAPLFPEGNNTISVHVGNSVDGTEQYAIEGQSGGNEVSLPDRAKLGVNFDVDSIISNLGQNFSILNFRKANFLQKYKEIIGSGSKDYQNIVKKIFGVDVPDTLSDHAIYLGGYISDVKISEVENTNLSDAQAIIKGKGIGSSNSSQIDFTADEFGHIMVIYHAQPVIDYSLNAFHFDVTKVNVDDYANPVFDKLGFQEFPTMYLDNSSSANTFQNPFIGWTTRYFDYKTSVDVTLDRFREDLSNWISPVNFDYLVNFISNGTILINSEFFKVNPKILDTIFAKSADDWIDTDQLQVVVNFEWYAVRNLDYIGVPYI